MPSLTKCDYDFNTQGDPEEIEANAFAMALLMPEDAVRQYARKAWPLQDMAMLFDVSPTTMRQRLKDLNLI